MIFKYFTLFYGCFIIILERGFMKTEIIKPKKEKKINKENNSLLTPIIYLILGVILAFYSNEAVQLIFYALGILIICYGLKSLVTYYQNKNLAQFKNINLSIGLFSIIMGILLIVLAGALETSIRYVLGFFLIYMGISRFLTDYSFGTYKNWKSLSNLVLVILGIYSIFVSNVIFVIVGWILILNAGLLFWDYLKH